MRKFIVGILAILTLFTSSSCYWPWAGYNYDGYDKIEDRIDLTLYIPFRENSKAARLNEISTLQIAENLPRLDGANALYPIYAAFAQAVYPESSYSPYTHAIITRSDTNEISPLQIEEHKNMGIVVCTSMIGAYRRLFDGEADIIFVFGSIKERLKYAEERGTELQFTHIGREAFIFFANSQNPIDGLTSSNLRKIYSGRVDRWDRLGGNNEEIRPYQRFMSSDSQMAFIEFMGDIAVVEPRYTRPGGGGPVAADYANRPNAIGYSFRFPVMDFIEINDIKPLEIDGVAPTQENIKNGSYPLVFELYAVTVRSKNPNIDVFLEWILSEQGQFLIEETGYVSLRQIE
jgi:phosphate transport system substrate-binding protein